MPEMTAFAGRPLTVYKRLEKICDYFSGEGTRSRRMTDAVLLRETRCDGSAHGGCQAECRIFWKEVWLEHAPEPADGPEPTTPTPTSPELTLLLEENTRRQDPELGEVFRCQATEAVKASTPMPEMAPAQYIREVRVGNTTVWKLLQVAGGAAVTKVARKLGLRPYLPVEVAGKNRVDGEKLDLKPGDWVRVRSAEEIGKTLNSKGAHRGMMFTHEMVPYCGETFRVHKRVNRLVDENTGQLLQMKTECISLEGVVCKGFLSSGAWFCAREHLPLWREDWLERVEPPSSISY